MDNIKGKKRIGLLIPLVLFLVFGLSLSLSQAQQTEGEPSEEVKLASAQLSETEALLPAISMDFQNANLKDVLKVFSQQADLNFIASENIKERRVTLYLDKVTVQDALSTIMSANNLTYKQEKDSKIFVVKEWGRPTVETITKIFPLQYARVRGYELSGAEEGETSGTGISEVIEKLLTTHGRVIEDARTNSLVISDVPTQFPKIEKAIKELDIKLPQVMIEAEIIEAKLTTIDKLGIQWGDTSSGALGSAFGAKRTDSFPFTKYSSSDASTFTTGYIDARNLGGTLAMLKSDSDTKILARPKILTLNNETAEIKITSDTALSSGTTISSGGEGITQESITIERFETGVSLLVTPQINKAGEITMFIEPSVITAAASAVLSSVYDPHERSAKTTVTVGDGETVIIGGLIKSEAEKIARKVPFFADVPFLGYLFRKKNDSITDKELIIFITPHLVTEGAEARGLALEKQAPWEYESLGLKEEAMDRILDEFEE